jgi:hypothetical protein
MLDGVRLATPSLGGLTLGAFGGLAPEVDSGSPGEAVRFGAEVAWRSPRLSANLVALGSVWDGALDERRLLAGAEGAAGPLGVSLHAEVSGFDADNPWGAPRLALTSAVAAARLRSGAWRAGAGVDWREPERSRWLASLLPASWLDDEAADRLAGWLDAGVDLHRLSLGAGASLVSGETRAAWADLRLWPFAGARLDLGITAATGPLLDTAALRVAAGTQLLRQRLDLSVFYRPSVLRYRASLGDLVEHRAGGDLAWSPTPWLDLHLGVEVLEGGDARGVLLLASSVVRLGR